VNLPFILMGMLYRMRMLTSASGTSVYRHSSCRL